VLASAPRLLIDDMNRSEMSDEGQAGEPFRIVQPDAYYHRRTRREERRERTMIIVAASLGVGILASIIWGIATYVYTG
jgi:hypothetical protein